MSVASIFISEKVEKLILINHSPFETSAKFQEATRRIISEIATTVEL